MACDVIEGRVQAPGGVIHEDEHWLVDHSVSPVMLAGFLIVKPKRHVEHIADLLPEEAASMGQVLRDTSLALLRVAKPDKVYVASFGSLVKHVHFYLIPRLPSMPEDLTGAELLTEVFSGRWAATDEEAAEVARRVREEYQEVLVR